MAPQVSIVVPTRAEAATIVPLLNGLEAALAGRDWEALVVDDDAGDGTAEAVLELARRQPRLRLLRRKTAPDLASAVREGLAAADGEFIGSLNADGSHDPAHLPALLAALDAGAEAAIGSRYAPGGRVEGWPWPRRALSRVSTAAARLLLGLAVADPLSGYYLVRRRVFDRCRHRLGGRGFKILLELLVRGRPEPVAEVPIRFRDRVAGRSKLSAAVLWRSALTLARLASARP